MRRGLICAGDGGGDDPAGVVQAKRADARPEGRAAAAARAGGVEGVGGARPLPPPGHARPPFPPFSCSVCFPAPTPDAVPTLAPLLPLQQQRQGQRPGGAAAESADGSPAEEPEPPGPGWLPAMEAAMADRGEWAPILLLGWGGDRIPRPADVAAEEWAGWGAEQQQRAVVRSVRRARAAGGRGRRFPIHCHCMTEEPKPDGAPPTPT